MKPNEVELSNCHDSIVAQHHEGDHLTPYCLKCGGRCAVHIAEYGKRTVEERQRDSKLLLLKILNNV